MVKGLFNKAFFFSIDALIAVILALSVLIIVPVFYMKEEQTTQPVYFSSDIVQLLSTMRIGEINNPAVADLINSSNITDTNRTILEQALRFQVQGEEEKAQGLLNLTIGGLIPDYYNLGIWIEGYEDPSYITNQTPIKQLISSKQMVSGIEKGRAIEGLSARIFLRGVDEKVSSTYVYFGGYEGDGNITKKFKLPSDIEITSAYMELDINDNFDFYINNVFTGSFIPKNLNTSIDFWNMSNITLFQLGDNTIEFRFNGSKRGYIGGGYFKVVYSTSEIALVQNETKYQFPGVKGIINIYDSFYIPGILKSVIAHLHYYNKYNIFFNIGNKTIYKNMECDGEYVIDLYDSNFSSLNYSSFSLKTVPIRLGTEAFELIEKAYNADVVLITDLSGSMQWRLDNSNTGTIRSCEDPLLYNPSTRRISLAKCLDKDFVNTIMNATGNRMGLVGFSDSAHTYTGNLDYTKDQLISHINGYPDSPSGGTCICCAINKAYELLADSMYSMAIIVPKEGNWLYNTSYPLTEPPNDKDGNNWTSINYNDSGWGEGNTILGFEKIAYIPYVNTNISINSVVLSNNSCNASDYFLINYSIIGGNLADTYFLDGNTLDIKYSPNLSITTIFYDGFEDYYVSGANQIDGNSINRAPGYWYVYDSAQEVYLMANYAGYSAYAGTDVLVFRDMDSYGYAETTINLTKYSNPKLSYWWKIGPNAFDSNEYGNVRIWDGSWHTVATYDSDDSDNIYHYAEIPLSSYNKVSNFKIRFGSRSSIDDERFYVDEVSIKEEEQLQPPEIWLNSTTLSYSEPFDRISARLLFKSNSSANYVMKIYNFNTSSWEFSDCDSRNVVANEWNDLWCFKANPSNYISTDDKIRIGLTALSDKATKINIDFAQYYTTMMNGNYYFRKHFIIDSKDAFFGARLYVLSDDKAEIYLNGYLVDKDSIDHNAEYWNSYRDINVSYLNEGDNVFTVKLHNKDDRSAKFDLQFEVNSSRQRYIIVMSDGIAGYHCGNCGINCSGGCTNTIGSYNCGGNPSDCTGSQCNSAINDAICGSCRAHNQINTTVYSVGFGPVSTCYNANRTLRSIADCGGGDYYTSSDANELRDIYTEIAENILSATYQAQYINVSGVGISPSILYPDSYIELKYTPMSVSPGYGLIPLTIESERFGNTITEGSFYVPNNVFVYDAKITSYSGDKWTDRALIKNHYGNWVKFYNLSEYSNNYLNLGDPYLVNIPIDLVQINKNNTVMISTAINQFNTTGGSPDDRAIYTIGIDIDINYTGVFEKAEGCNWLIKFEDDTDTTIAIPSTYDGGDSCNFDETTDCGIEYNNDAINNAACHLFKQLDFDDDGKLFVKFGPEDLDFEIYSIGRIPFMWGPTIVEVRVWK